MNRDHKNTATSCNLFLNGHDKPVEKFVPKDQADVMLFDYQKFWKERYKKLMRSH